MRIPWISQKEYMKILAEGEAKEYPEILGKSLYGDGGSMYIRREPQSHGTYRYFYDETKKYLSEKTGKRLHGINPGAVCREPTGGGYRYFYNETDDALAKAEGGKIRPSQKMLLKRLLCLVKRAYAGPRKWPIKKLYRARGITPADIMLDKLFTVQETVREFQSTLSKSELADFSDMHLGLTDINTLAKAEGDEPPDPGEESEKLESGDIDPKTGEEVPEEEELELEDEETEEE